MANPESCVQNSKASKMFDSQPLGHVICSMPNYIDYNLIILIFKGDVLINFEPSCPHCGGPPPLRGDVLNGCFLRLHKMENPTKNGQPRLALGL